MSPLRRFGQGPSYSPPALLVRVQCFRKGQYKAVEGPSKRPLVLSMINGSYCRRPRRLIILDPDEMKFGVFDPPKFVNKITEEDRVRDSLCHIFLERIQVGSRGVALRRVFDLKLSGIHWTQLIFKIWVID